MRRLDKGGSVNSGSHNYLKKQGLELSTDYITDGSLVLFFAFGKDWSLFNLFSAEPTASSLVPTLPFQEGSLPCILGSKRLGFVQCFGQSALRHRYSSQPSYLDDRFGKDESH